MKKKILERKLNLELLLAHVTQLTEFYLRSIYNMYNLCITDGPKVTSTLIKASKTKPNQAKKIGYASNEDENFKFHQVPSI